MAYQELDTEQVAWNHQLAGDGECGEGEIGEQVSPFLFLAPHTTFVALLGDDAFGHGSEKDALPLRPCGQRPVWECVFLESAPFSLPLLPHAAPTPKSAISNRNSGRRHEDGRICLNLTGVEEMRVHCGPEVALWSRRGRILGLILQGLTSAAIVTHRGTLCSYLVETLAEMSIKLC